MRTSDAVSPPSFSSLEVGMSSALLDTKEQL